MRMSGSWGTSHSAPYAVVLYIHKYILLLLLLNWYLVHIYVLGIGELTYAVG